MGFGSYLANGFRSFFFSKDAIIANRDEPLGFRYALIFHLVFPIVIILFFKLIFGFLTFGGLLFLSLLFSAFCHLFCSQHFVAKIFGGSGSSKQLHSVLGVPIAVSLMIGLLVPICPLLFTNSIFAVLDILGLIILLINPFILFKSLSNSLKIVENISPLKSYIIAFLFSAVILLISLVWAWAIAVLMALS